ncbi:hypothetical protein [Streptomyces sp. NPDC021622]|uniref:hypothetical protein n=1 Tax=Streptomyces sp. NPDC021622 TaxID=3155013 RepID=UPI0033C628FF
MSEWAWDWNPSEEYLTDGFPPGVVAEVERLATELAALGLPVPRHECVCVCNITWYG